MLEPPERDFGVGELPLVPAKEDIAGLFVIVLVVLAGQGYEHRDGGILTSGLLICSFDTAFVVVRGDGVRLGQDVLEDALADFVFAV